jgi:hypothetical protein
MDRIVDEIPVAYMREPAKATNDRLDSRSSPHQALEGRRHAALLAGGEDPELVAAIR